MSKKRVFDIIQIGNAGDWQSRTFDFAIIFMILTNLFLAIFETYDCAQPYLPMMHVIEGITVVCFTIEYILRVWTSDYLYPNLDKSAALRRYVFSFTGIIDLLSFLPFYLPFFFPSGVVAFRMFRVVRIFRLFRINAYYDALNVITDVIRSKKDQLLSSIFIILVLITAASLAMYSLEHEAQPEVFRNAFSGIWWAVSTLLTVGYGDIYPVTTLGRILGIMITFLGVGMVAIPTGILSAGFVEQYTSLESYNDPSLESNIRFLSLDVLTEEHIWYHKRIKDLPLPPGLIFVVIHRDGETLVPHGDTIIERNDHIILGAKGFSGDIGITLNERILINHHPWIGQKIGELDISRQTFIVTVRRGDEVLIPTGSLVLQEGDIILLYNRKRTHLNNSIIR